MNIATRGFLKSSRKQHAFFKVSIVIFLSVLLFGCGGTREIEDDEGGEGTATETLQQAEAQFNPSAYNPTFQQLIGMDSTADVAPARQRDEAAPTDELVQGFRVQVLFTSEIEKANRVKDSLSNQLLAEWVYVVYEAPYYKIRVGNFLTRVAAKNLIHPLVDLGYRDAWIVPDQVFRNPVKRTEEGVK